MTVYYLQNELKVAAQSAENGVYAAVYLKEMVDRLGVPAKKLAVSDVAATAFEADDVVLVGAETLAADVVAALTAANQKGVLVIGFATKGAEELFGCTIKGKVTQTDLYETIGLFTAPQSVLPANKPNLALPVMADVLATLGGKVQATIQVGDQLLPGLVAGDNTYYVPFDLPYCLLKIIQGKPVAEGPSNYFPVGRIPDSRAMNYELDTSDAMADLYYLMLENLLYSRNLPMIHVLPVMKDGVTPSDLLFFYAGDDDNTSGELDERASQIMYQKGLPYHLNLMPGSENGDYQLTKEDYDRIAARGHEMALHYNLTGVPFSYESFKQQMGTYEQAYSELPVSNVGHCLAFAGYAEYARWQAALGAKGDAGRQGTLNLADINAFNIYDFGFGTAFPHYIYDDADHKTQRIEFVGIPISYYEPRIGGQYGEDGEKLYRCADNAGYYGQTINLFSHPHYVAFWQGYDSTMTLRAFDTILNYCASKGWQVYNAGPDELCLWWMERDAASIAKTADGVQVTLAGENPLVLKLPACAQKVQIDGKEVAVTPKTIGGLAYNLVVVSGKGDHTVTY